MDRNRGRTIWFTGLSGSGKTTLSSMLKKEMESRRVPVVLLDGDMLRHGLNRDLGFSALDRAENIRRAGEVAKILSAAGHTVIAAFITPMESLRQAVRGIFEPGRYVEIYLDCSLEVCETRDPKGLYSRARAGEIPEFTGITSPFERPHLSDLVVPTGDLTVDDSLNTILGFIEDRFPDLACSSDGAPNPVPVTRKKKVVVIGLDGAPPRLIFEDEEMDLPNLRALMQHGTWGSLRSTDPPITVPAWTTMTTGKDPGELGLYGFRNRMDNSYGKLVTVDASQVMAARVWDRLESSGKRTILLGVPQTYPPQAHNGITVCDFLSPNVKAPATYPPEFAGTLQEIAGGPYMADVSDFRTDDKDRLLTDLYTMVRRRFRAARNLLLRESWDFFMMVEMATDRLHHAFWRYANSDHPHYEPNNPYKDVIRNFYAFLDGQVGSLLALLDDDTSVFVVSDHGTRTMQGGVCINKWLVENGFLTLKEQPNSETSLEPDMIDWSQTIAWSEGGYYARVFLNVKGREPQGIIDEADYESERERLARLLSQMKDGEGRHLSNRILRPEQIYRSCTNVPPDLMVYFDDLSMRSIGTVGTGKIFQTANDTGPDDANHDPEGIFICTRMSELRRGRTVGKETTGASLEDITPTILNEFEIALPSDLYGRIVTDAPAQMPVAMAPSAIPVATSSMPQKEDSTPGYTSEEEELVKKRLADLGYI